MSAAIAPITEGPQTSVTKQPNKYDDPEHPSLWVCKFKPNPVYEGPADLYLNKDSQGPDRHGNTKMIRYYFNPKTQQKMPFKPNFYTWKKARRYAERSCCCLKDTNPLRRKLVNFVTSPPFEAVILITVFLNTIFIMMPNYDYRSVDVETLEPLSLTQDGCCALTQPLPPPCNKTTPGTLCLVESCPKAALYDDMCCPCPAINMIVLSVAAEWVFLLIFVVEMILKMVAFGVLPGNASWYGSYFTDMWNVLDFVIVMAALVLASYPTPSGPVSVGPSLGFLRVIRVLRPLRSLSIIPSMRRMVTTLLISISELLAVVLLLFFIFLIFGALMIQIYAGQLRYTCRLTNFPLQLPVISLKSPEYNQDGVGWKNYTEVNWCTSHDDWDNVGWPGFFPNCNGKDNLFANTRKSTLHKETFYHKLEDYPFEENGATKYKTQYFYFNRSKDWHRFHRQLMLNASALKETNDPYRHSALRYESDVLNMTGIFRPCHDDEGITIPISFEQCNRICHNQQVDGNNGRTSPCQVDSSTARCELWKNRKFDRYNKTDSMCEKYCPDKNSGDNWDLPSGLKTPEAGLSSPWRNVTSESMPFYNGHRHCFWPNDNGEHETKTANRFCSAWFRSVYDDGEGFNKCPSRQYCGSDYDATGNLRFHGFEIVNTAIYKGDLLWGIPQFNNFPEAFLSIFQSITLEGWVDILYTVADRMSYLGTAIIFVLMVFIGGIFLLNMTLAVISDSFASEREKEHEEHLRRMLLRDAKEIAMLEAAKPKPVDCVQKTCLCCGTKPGHEESGNCCLKSTHSFVTSAPFELFILIAIIINFITLCLEFYRAPYVLEEVLDYVNFFLTLIFIVEMVLKLIGLGLRDYFKNSWNVFDFFIVVFSIVEYMLAPPLFFGVGADGGNVADFNFKVLRTFRVFRVFKLAKEWRHLALVLGILGKSLKDVALFFLLLFIFLVIFAVWGMQLFSNRFHFDPITHRVVKLELNDDLLPTQAYLDADVPDTNFDGLYPSIMTVFQICSGENWNAVMYDGMRSRGWDSVFFFFIMFAILVMIVLELFVAILLGHFEEDDEEEEEEEEEMEICCCCFLIGPKPEEEEDAIGSMSCCKKKNTDDSSSQVAPEEAEPGVENDNIVRLLDVGGPLTRWLAACSPGMEQKVFEFYCAGVEKVAQFETMENDGVLPKLNLDAKQIAAITEHAKKPIPTGCDLTAFEEVTMLRIRKLQGEKRRTEHYLDTKRHAIKERMAAGELLSNAEQSKNNDILTNTEKRVKSITVELNTLEAKLTPDVKALCCIPRNKCRIALNAIVEYPSFDSAILLCILVSTIMLMMETPLMLKPNHWVKSVFSLGNWIFAWIFIGEMVLKILAKGFLMHNNAYLRNAWNILDFLIVLVSIVLMVMDVMEFLGFGVGGGGLSALRALRAMRALRPLRSIRRMPELRVIVLALLGSLPKVMQTMLVVVIFFMVFSVMGVNFYKGGFTYCDFSELEEVTDAMKELELCNERNSLANPQCLPWPNLTSAQRVEYIAESTNDYDKTFTTLYNNAVKGGTVLDWDSLSKDPKTCDLSLYISNSITNWTSPGPKCTMEIGETMFSPWFDYSYYLTGNKNSYLNPTSKNICQWMGGNWDKVIPQSFNNVLIGLISWFELSSTEGWVDAMYAATAYRGEDMEPKPVDIYKYDSDFLQRYVASTLFFVFFIVFGHFLLTNMFVGTVCLVFQEMRTAGDNTSVFLTDQQKEWQRRQKTVMRLQPFLKPKAPENPARAKIYWAVTSGPFDSFIFLCILINTFIMMMRFFPTLIPQHWQVGFATEIANIVFAIIFFFEALFKIIGLGQQYFCKKNCRSKKQDPDGSVRTSCTCAYADNWNLFDFIIVVGTMFGLVTKYSAGFSGINAFTTIIRTFRVARIFRLVKHPMLKKLKLLISTIIVSGPSIFNLAVVLILFLCIFSILGVQLFAFVEHNDALTDHANFQSFPVALLTLFRGTTGENWNGLMHSVARNSSSNCSFNIKWDPSLCGYCEWDQFYTPGGDPLKCVECLPLNGCGQPILSEGFFLAYTFFITYMIMNIFVAVILEAYEQSSLDESAVVTEDDLARFKAEWAVFDVDSDMTISLAQLPQLMDELPFPMGFKKQESKLEVESELPPETYEPTNRCFVFAPSLDEDNVEQNKFHQLNENEKQKEIDEMDIHSYEENGDAQVRFRDILFACVQRAYKIDSPASAFSIDESHKERLQDETKTMSAVPIKTSHYLSALRIAQAYRAHKFRNHFIGMQMQAVSKASSEQKFSEGNKRKEAFNEETGAVTEDESDDEAAR